MFGLSTLATRIALAAIAIVLVLGFLQVRSCQQAKQRAAEARVERAQGKAGMESAKDAITTQGQVNERERASEELTTKNAEEIRNAPGANDPINPELAAAGVRAVCRRATYRDTERCRLLVSDSAKLEAAR